MYNIIICLIYPANQHVSFSSFRPDLGSGTWKKDDQSPSGSHEQESEDENHPSPDDMDLELESENKFQATAFAKLQKTVKHP